MDYPPRIYYLSLHLVGLTIGAAVLLAHLFGLLRPADTQKFLLKLPRSRMAGLCLSSLRQVVRFWLVLTRHLGEVSRLWPFSQPPTPGLFFFLSHFLRYF